MMIGGLLLDMIRRKPYGKCRSKVLTELVMPAPTRNRRGVVSRARIYPVILTLSLLILVGFRSGCGPLPPMKLYQGKPRPVQGVATLVWFREARVADFGYIDSIDGKILDVNADCGYGRLLPGEHRFVLGYGVRHPFIRPLTNLWRCAEFALTAHLEAGRYYKLDFQIGNGERVLEGNDELKYLINGKFVRSGPVRGYETEFWPISGRPEAMPDSMYPLRFRGLWWVPVIKEMPLTDHNGVWPDEWFNAAYRGNIRCIRDCLARGDDIDRRDADGVTALYVASWKGHTKIVELLLERNAEVDCAHTDGVTALWKAAEKGHADIVRLLLKHNANVNVKTKRGRTSLRVAVENGHARVVEILLEAGCDANARAMDGQTPLGVAKQKGYRRIVAMLIEHGGED